MININLVGGPDDGRSIAVPNDVPPLMYLIPIEQPIACLDFDSPLDLLQPLRTAEYRPVADRFGRLSRTDDGAYRYAYRNTFEPPHSGQSRPTPTLEELAEMRHEPPLAAYPDKPSHLLACRTRYSLRRDARPNEEERAVSRRITLEHAQEMLRERHHQDE
jgi:hypothetical protein